MDMEIPHDFFGGIIYLKADFQDVGAEIRKL